MPQNLKALIMSKSFPKFVWITEVSDESIPSGEAKGLIILDATEAILWITVLDICHVQRIRCTI